MGRRSKSLQASSRNSNSVMAKRIKMPIKSESEISKMRIAGEAASRVLQATAQFIQPGRTTAEVDSFAAELIADLGGIPTFLGYRGFPGNICISINEEVVHGIGGSRRIQPGDLVSVDIGVTIGGWIGDNAVTVPVGPITPENQRLLAVTEQSLFEAIDHAREGVRLADLCGSVESHVNRFGFTVVRQLVGHGVGKELHEKPEVPNFRPNGPTPRLKAGMILALSATSAAIQGRACRRASYARRASSHLCQTARLARIAQLAISAPQARPLSCHARRAPTRAPPS